MKITHPEDRTIACLQLVFNDNYLLRCDREGRTGVIVECVSLQDNSDVLLFKQDHQRIFTTTHVLTW